MSAHPRVIAVGFADEFEVAGTSGVRATWKKMAMKPLGNGISYRKLFGPRDETFRRLDLQSKAIVVAAAATGMNELLSDEEREAAALVTETTCGSIEVDLRYTSVLASGIAHGAIFPYTLQSTCIGDVALRHGLRGPTVCMSVDPESRGEALHEARRMLLSGEIRHAVIGSVDALGESMPGLDASLRAVVAIVEAPGPGGALARPEVAEWPTRTDVDPFETWARACRSMVVQ